MVLLLKKLPKTSENSGGLNYSEVFHKLIAENNINPGLFLAVYASDYLNSSHKESKLTGFLARGMRTFASLIREQDLAINMKNSLITEDETVLIEMDPDQDTKTHVDIRITFRNKIFNLWSYQASKNAIYPHTIERVTGQRNEIPNGFHILCPINTDEGKTLLEKRISLEKNSKTIINWTEQFNDSKKTQNSLRKKLLDQIKRAEDKILILKNDVEKLETICLNEIEISEGWFFYSDKYIKRVAEIINKANINIDFQYNELKNILLKPETILRKITVFNK